MPIKAIWKYLKLEAAGGVILFFFAVLAILIDNSPFSSWYQDFLTTPFVYWINEGLMTLFFLLISLELKREFLEGELSDIKQILLPGMAALGGMLAPAAVYFIITHQHGIAVQGWAIPVATDIAFALGVLALLGKRVPLGLKLFLMALAIFDDIGAIFIIGVFYSEHLAYIPLLLTLIILVGLFLLNRCRVRSLFFYAVLGVLLWMCLLKSGIHATLAGVLAGLFIPLKTDKKQSPLKKLEHILHPWVAFGVMPLFAFVNAGVSLTGLTWQFFLQPVPLGILGGLILGKQLGVFSMVWLMIRLGWAKLPKHTTWLELYGVALLCGIGFTMSLFLGTLAFRNASSMFLVEVRLGVLLGSLISGVLGVTVLKIALGKKMKGKFPA